MPRRAAYRRSEYGATELPEVTLDLDRIALRRRPGVPTDSLNLDRVSQVIIGAGLVQRSWADIVDPKEAAGGGSPAPRKIPIGE